MSFDETSHEFVLDRDMFVKNLARSIYMAAIGERTAVCRMNSFLFVILNSET
jgi:hypothetical protein